jgi:hypothetical protein
MATLPNASTEAETNSSSTPTGTRRVNVIFSQEQFETLQRIANSQGINLSDALRQAINVSDVIVGANADKDTQILIKRGNSVQELKIVR